MTDEVIAGRYRLIDPIGTGGSGTVWRAVDLQLGQWCAAKLLRQRDAGELLRFVREQSVRLNHPHIVSPYAWAADDGSVLIAAELVDGGSLQTLLGDWGALSDGTITVILEQLLDALQAVHQAQLIHRDVKPGNVLLRASGSGQLDVALTDFGLTISAQDARLTAMGMVIGTPGYLPPELLAGRVSPEPNHDLYALGRLAITLAAGETKSERLPQQLFDDPALRATVTALIAADPKHRPTDASAALVLLTDAARDPLPRTRDGDSIVVADQLPPLPVDRAHLVKPDGGRVELPTTAVELQVPEISQPVGTAQTDLRDVPTTVVTASTPGRRRGWALPVAGVAALAAVVTTVVVLTSQSADPESPTVPPETGTSEQSETSSEAGSTSRPTDEALAIGDECSWQVEGVQRATTDGVALVCTATDGRYLWAPG